MAAGIIEGEEEATEVEADNDVNDSDEVNNVDDGALTESYTYVSREISKIAAIKIAIAITEAVAIDNQN